MAVGEPTLREIWFSVPEGSRAIVYGILEDIEPKIKALSLSKEQTRVVAEIFKESITNPPEE